MPLPSNIEKIPDDLKLEYIMGYYLRFISTDKRPIDLQEVAAGLRRFDPKFSIEMYDGTGSQLKSGTMVYDGNKCADLEINTKEDGLFEDEVEELLDFVSDMSGNKKHIVTQFLQHKYFFKTAKSIQFWMPLTHFGSFYIPIELESSKPMVRAITTQPGNS